MIASLQFAQTLIAAVWHPGVFNARVSTVESVEG